MSAGGVPKTEAAYRTVGSRLLKLRRSRRVPYDSIADGTRWQIRPRSHDDLKDALNDTSLAYRRALWNHQEVDVAFFTEKDAITGVISPVTTQWDVPLGVLRGYSSETFAYEMAAAFSGTRRPLFVYQLGDHDPSGVGAWNDFKGKVGAFMSEMDPGAEVTFERIAVTPEQIVEMNLPTRPTKQSDTRAKGFAGESVEVDAIPATVLRQLVTEAIEGHIDQHSLGVTKLVEEQERGLLSRMFDLVPEHDDGCTYLEWDGPCDCGVM